MSGQAGLRGYLLQTIICLLEVLEPNNDWQTVTLEPDVSSEKVDILWQYRNKTRAVQVKSSQNAFHVPEVKEWANELLTTFPSATEHELILLGPTSQGVIDLGNSFNNVIISPPKSIEPDDLKEQACHKLDKYLETKDLPKTLSDIRELIVGTLTTQIEIYSTKGKSLSREELDNLLNGWISVAGGDKLWPNYSEISGFEKDYLNELSIYYQYMPSANMGRKNRTKIDDLYVLPTIALPSKNPNAESTFFKCEEFVPKITKTVLLGDPGVGKSTFSQKLCYEISLKNWKLNNGKETIPFLVILREYEKQYNENSIIKFIENNIKKRYNLEKVNINTIEYFLMSGKALVVFDGLDEILNLNLRQEIVSNIESFCRRFPSITVLITCRIVDYRSVQFDYEQFSTFHINPFDFWQVEEYADKWFKINTDYLPEEKEKVTQNFIQESAEVFDLRSNPLLLSLMCLIYKGKNRIPENRPALYKQCAELLFEDWDSSRLINTANRRRFESHIRPLLAYLAYTIYDEPKLLSKGISKARLIQETTVFLEPDYGKGKAEVEAKDFIEFCSGRAWVFTDMDVEEETGEVLYNFTHKTFLEYFVAFYLAHKHESTHDLVDVLLPRIESQEWDMVVQLAFQEKAINSGEARNKIFERLIEGTKREHLSLRSSFNIFYFMMRLLNLISPQRTTLSKIIKESINFYIDYFKGHTKRLVPDQLLSSQLPEPIFADLLHYNKDRDFVKEQIELDIQERIKKVNVQDEEIFVLWEFAFCLGSFLKTKRSWVNPDKELIDFWHDTSDGIVKNCFPHEKGVWKLSVGYCLRDYYDKFASINDLIDLYGMEVLFSRHFFKAANIRLFSFIELFLAYYAKGAIDKIQATHTIYVGLEQLSPIILLLETPLITRPIECYTYLNNTFAKRETSNESVSQSSYTQEKPNISTNVLFSSCVLFAIILDLAKQGCLHEGLPVWRRSMIENDSQTLSSIKWIALAKFRIHLSSPHKEKCSDEKVLSYMDDCQFSLKQKNLINKWINREIKLVDIVY